jgi:hypothetical protein
VDIPPFPILAEELVKAKAGTSDFYFPEAALMYRSNPDGITWRVKQVLARALEAKPPADPLPTHFSGATLARTNFGRDNLGGATSLQSANLSAATIHDCHFDGARYDSPSKFPAGVNPDDHGLQFHKRAEPCAAPNDGPATQLGNSDPTEGPPSVS